MFFQLFLLEQLLCVGKGFVGLCFVAVTVPQWEYQGLPNSVG